MNTELGKSTINQNLASSTLSTEQYWVADKALDKQEKLTEEEINKKYHDYLSQINAEEGSGTSKDRMARMASIVASKNLMI